MNKRFAFILFTLAALLAFSRCAVRSDAADNYTFSWDISAENHTGESNDHYSKDRKHRGMSVFHWRQEDMNESANQLIKNNIEWVAIIPFLYQRSDTTKILRPSGKEGNWTRYDSVHIGAMKVMHDRGLHTMLKPHIWMSEGWRSDIELESDTEWDTWFNSYEEQMLHYAMLAEYTGAELFCIGTELRSSIINQPERWDQFITNVKKIYGGKLCYAANWDGEYEKVKFWDRMDYIGLQAYFPLTDNASPSLMEIQDGWDQHIKLLEKLSKQHNKPILFTETGYRSHNTATIRPWEWNNYEEIDSNSLSLTTQNLAYEALFRKLWHREWFAGVYFWQWHNTSKEGNTRESTDFTPRYKPAENTMAKWYGKSTK